MIYKTIQNLRRIDSQEMIPAGAYFSDDEPYDPDGTLQTISTGERLPGSQQTPSPILFRAGFWSDRGQEIKNLLQLAGLVEVVDKTHSDYARLVEFGVIIEPKKKPSKEATADKDSES